MSAALIEFANENNMILNAHRGFIIWYNALDVLVQLLLIVWVHCKQTECESKGMCGCLAKKN
jgi:hypothetical protein